MLRYFCTQVEQAHCRMVEFAKRLAGNSMKVFLTLIFFTICSSAVASDLEDLAKQGYAVVDKTYVSGEFEGCDFDKQIPLANGLIFVCSVYSYSYSYQPEVFILKNYQYGDVKVLINGQNYNGKLYRR